MGVGVYVVCRRKPGGFGLDRVDEEERGTPLPHIGQAVPPVHHRPHRGFEDAGRDLPVPCLDLDELRVAELVQDEEIGARQGRAERKDRTPIRLTGTGVGGLSGIALGLPTRRG